MADVTCQDGDRGQLLMITALALAVLLIIMALALNTAVLGEIYAGQTDDSLREERGAVQYHDATKRGVTGLIPLINNEYSEYDALEHNLDREINNWSTMAQREYAREDIVTNTSLSAVTFETTIIQNTSQDFTDQSNRTSWTVAENVSTVDDHTLNVSDSGLGTAPSCVNESSCFVLTVEGSDDRWEMKIYTTANSTVEADVTSSNGTETCETSSSPITINVTTGIFNPDGSGCEFTSFQDDPAVTPPYTVSYSNADNITGTYELTVSGRLTDGTIEDDTRYETTGSPRLSPQITRANVTVRYQSIDLTYRTSLWVPAEGGQ